MATAAQASAAARPAQVLLAADKVSLVHIRDLLAKTGYEVVAVSQGSQALELLQASDPPKLAVLDWTMPDISGLEICRRLQRFQGPRNSYIILLTAWNQQNDRVVGLEAGADDCMYKPVDVRELRLRLQIGAQIILERALRESEERFHSAFEYAGAGMGLISSGGEFLQVNPALCEFFGYSGHSAAELKGMELFRFDHPEEARPLRAVLEQFLAEGHLKGEFERRFLTRNQELAWGALTLSAILDTESHPVHLVVQVQNISKRKQAEEALRQSAALLQAITDNAEDLILVCDLDYNWRYASPSVTAALGYPIQELIGANAREIIHPEDLPHVDIAASSVVSAGQARTLTVRYRHKNGSWRHLEACGTLVRAASGAPEGFIVVARVVDERILAEKKLQAAHAETELFLNSIPSIVIGLDAEGQITRWNRTAVLTLGLSPEAVLGRKILDCGIQWLHPEMAAEVARWLNSPRSYRSEDLAYEREGQVRFLGVVVRRLPSEEGEPASFILTGTDVTERKVLEDQLRQAQKLEAIGQLAAGIAHEINTPTQYVGDNTRFLKDSWQPLAGFLQFCGNLQRQASAGTATPQALQEFVELYQRCDFDYLLKEIPHAIDQSLEGLQRVSKIVRGMKEFSHPGTEEKRAVNLNRAIETTITVARHEWKYCADVVTRFDEELPLVPCLIGEFNQVMLNLIINAAHAVAAAIGEEARKGILTITTRREGEWAEVSVTDTGTGIAPEIRSRIFEPFFTTKPMGKGTGQGLALAHSVIVKRHQGQLWFETEVGRGTTFFLRLPLETGSTPP